MKKQKLPVEINDVLAVFKTIEGELAKTGQKMRVTVLGGISVILQGFIKRATRDIDIAPTTDARAFAKICKKINIPVDIVTIASTVDLVHTTTLNQYSGPFLTVDSVTAPDLIKLKLERFYKHDPEDIFAIIDHTNISYQDFRSLVKEMLTDFIGNPRGPMLSAREVTERKFPAFLEDFDREFNK